MFHDYLCNSPIQLKISYWIINANYKSLICKIANKWSWWKLSKKRKKNKESWWMTYDFPLLFKLQKQQQLSKNDLGSSLLDLNFWMGKNLDRIEMGNTISFLKSTKCRWSYSLYPWLDLNGRSTTVDNLAQPSPTLSLGLDKLHIKVPRNYSSL